MSGLLDWQMIWWVVALVIALIVVDWIYEYLEDKYCSCDKPVVVEHLDGFKTCGMCRKEIKQKRGKV